MSYMLQLLINALNGNQPLSKHVLGSVNRTTNNIKFTFNNLKPSNEENESNKSILKNVVLITVTMKTACC